MAFEAQDQRLKDWACGNESSYAVNVNMTDLPVLGRGHVGIAAYEEMVVHKFNANNIFFSRRELFDFHVFGPDATLANFKIPLGTPRLFDLRWPLVGDKSVEDQTAKAVEFAEIINHK